MEAALPQVCARCGISEEETWMLRRFGLTLHQHEVPLAELYYRLKPIGSNKWAGKTLCPYCHYVIHLENDDALGALPLLKWQADKWIKALKEVKGEEWVKKFYS